MHLRSRGSCSIPLARCSSGASPVTGLTHRRNEERPSLLPSPDAQSVHMRERYELLRSVVLRNEHFLPPLAVGPSSRERTSFMKLTTTKNLLGRQGESCLLFGRLSTQADGSYALEDAEGTVELDLTHAIPGEGVFTEGAFVLVEGEYTQDERLQALAIGHPPSEPRDASWRLFGHVDFYGTSAMPEKNIAKLRTLEEQHSDQCIAVFSDVHLDIDRSLANLRAILQGYEDADFIPFAIVLCGNFCSTPASADGEQLARYQRTSAGYAVLTPDGFQRLADVLMHFPHIMASCHFVFVPGPADLVATPLLPRARLPAPLTDHFEQKLPRAFVNERLHWMSNPCRLLYFSQEIVIFRDDLMSKMLRSTVRLKDEVKEGDLQKFLVSTILDQAHLSPLPQQVRPLLWEHAHALRLYPMPSAVRACAMRC